MTTYTAFLVNRVIVEKLTKEKMQSLITVGMLSGSTELRYSIGPEANEINRDQTVKGFNSYNKGFELFFLKAMGSHGGIIKSEQLRNHLNFRMISLPFSGVWLKVNKGGKDKLNTV